MRADLIDSLAQEIRRVDGNHSLGAGALAEALMPFIEASLQSGSAGEVAGWIAGNGDGTLWRYWTAEGPQWTGERECATRYARREDAEAVHGEDEDVWTIEPLFATPAKAAGGWRLMKGAPKDGQQVLLRVEVHNGDPIAIQGWFERAPADMCWYDVTDTPVEPTHWMPLPASPSPDGERQGGGAE